MREPQHALHGIALAILLGGAALYLFGESLFHWRMTRMANAKRLSVAAVLLGLAPVAGHLTALMLSALVAVELNTLALREQQTSGYVRRGARRRGAIRVVRSRHA